MGKCREGGGAHFNKIMTLQKKALGYIARAKYNTHTNSLFLKYNLLEEPDIVDYNLGIFMYKYKANKQPDSFINFFSPLNSFDRSLLNHSLRLQAYPSYSFARFWNGLNLEIKRSRSLNCFKKAVFNSLCSTYLEK